MPDLRKLTCILFLLFPFSVNAQTENWDVYLAQYEKGVGSTLVDMALKSSTLQQRLKFLVITGVAFTDCKPDGLPSKKEFTNLYRVADSIKSVITKLVENRSAGIFTYKCDRRDYYYVKDTALLRQTLENLYATRFPQYKPYINIREDKNWSAYSGFLYPNAETFEYMQNQKVVMHLQESGDKLIKPRTVDHWLYFKTEHDRDCFISYASKNNFKIEGKEKMKDIELPFKLHISKTSKVDTNTITAITSELRKQAQKCNGDYDGWETALIKDQE